MRPPAAVAAAIAGPFGGSHPAIDLNFLSSGPLDSRLTFTGGGSVSTYFDNTGTMQSGTNNVARFDYNPATLLPNGLLIEEGRTNGIRNPRGEGASIGVSGALPTDWAVVNSAGGTCTFTPVAVSTENGIPYTDVRIQSASLGNTAVRFAMELQGSAAAPGQVWIASSYVKLVAGTMTNINTVNVELSFVDGSNVLLGGGSVATGFVPLSTALNVNRQMTPSTTAPASTASIRFCINFAVPSSGVPIDITVRIGAPQAEVGAFATSVMLPPVGTPGTSTRNVETASMPVSSAWFNSSAYTMVAESNLPVASGSGNFQAPCELDDGTTSHRTQMFRVSGNNNFNIQQADAGFNQQVGPLTPGTTFKAGISTTAGQQLVAFNGVAGTSGSGSQTTGITTLRVGYNVQGLQVNGYIRRLRLWKLAMTQAQLNKATT